MSQTGSEDERTGSWRQLAEALAAVSTAWRVAGADQAHSGPPGTPAVHQLDSAEADELATAGYEAVEALAGLATVLAGQQNAPRVWEQARDTQQEVWRRWRVAMDAQTPDEDTPP